MNEHIYQTPIFGDGSNHLNGDHPNVWDNDRSQDYLDARMDLGRSIRCVNDEVVILVGKKKHSIYRHRRRAAMGGCEQIEIMNYGERLPELPQPEHHEPRNYASR